MSGCDREVFQHVQEWSGGHPDVREWSGGTLECSGVVERPSRISCSGRVAVPDIRKSHSDVREWSGGFSGCLVVVGRPS